MNDEYRIEKDVLGEVKVPREAYWGVNTQRALNNFQISDKRFSKTFLISLAEVKKAALLTNKELGIMEREKANAIQKVVEEIVSQGKFLDQFPLDVFQTGSGTQINMNMNEVLANRANELLGFEKGKKYPVHPNDDVNKSQSSNDVIPTTMHLATLSMMEDKLFPALNRLIKVLQEKISEFEDIIKVGRTHLQDAVPIPLALEFKVYKRQIEINRDRLESDTDELSAIPLGGTVLGTGINTPDMYTNIVVEKLSAISGIELRSKSVLAEGISSHNTIVNVSSTVKNLALSLLKMANDIRWIGSGPRAGLSELKLPANEPGSSIMPGKINPTQSEALIQVCLHVMGNDLSISNSEGLGSILDLNVCKPIMIHNLLESIDLISNAINSFVEKCLKGLEVNKSKIEKDLENLLMIVTNLTPYIGYDKASEIAQKAYKEDKNIKEVVLEMELELEEDIDEILDPKKMI
jgi:fumarate hydratase class II